MPSPLPIGARRALEQLTKHGRLIQLPGGSWTYPGCQASHKAQSGAGYIMQWYVGTPTIEALIRRNLAARTPDGTGIVPL